MSYTELRIAQVAPLWASVPPKQYGGIELCVSLLTEELVRRGHDVTLYASGDSVTAARQRSVIDVSMLDLMTDLQASTYEFYANAQVAEALKNSGEFDVVHFHLDPQWIALGSLSKCPALFTLHTMLGEDDGWVFDRYPDVAVAGISRSQITAFTKEQRRIPVVYNACDFSKFTPSFEQGKYLAFLGRMSHDKNPLDAIRIAQKAGMPIVLAGKPQQKKEVIYFEENIKPLIDGEQVKYIGAVNHLQKNELLRNASALLFPVQWAEPFGMVMIEAMACGTPVVGYSLGAVPEVVKQGVTGYHASTMQELADLMPKALELDRHTVRESAENNFGVNRMTDMYEKLYRSLIQ